MHLRHISVDGVEGQHIAAKARLQIKDSGKDDCSKVLFDVENLIDAVATLFRGWCPAYMPYLLFAELHPLPWGESYLQRNGEYSTQIGVSNEVEQILDELFRFSKDSVGLQFPALEPALTLNFGDYKSDKQQIQGMAAEALLALDQCIEEMICERPFAAMKWLSSGYKFLMEAIHQAWPKAEKSTAARIRANTRHTKDSDGKQAIKQQVKDCWDTWQKKPDRYRGKAAFARDMLDKFDALQSQDVIERWCRDWEKGTQPAQ